MPDIDGVTLEHPPTALEELVRAYLETVGGVWEEVEPQVYDVLLPATVPAGAPGGVLRITFDPEALPEHPGAAGQLRHAAHRPLAGRCRGPRPAESVLPSRPEPGAARPGSAAAPRLTLAPPLELQVERARALHFVQVVFWFQAEFVSDQKEEEILPVAMDLHYGREVRHLELLLDRTRLAEQPALPLPEARRRSVAAVYPTAREQVLRSLAALASTRNRELADRLQRQIARMTRYYADLREELVERRRRLRGKEEGADRLDARRAAIDHEEQVRITELRQKSTLRVHLRLLQMVLIQQPKLLVHAGLAAAGGQPVALEAVWDPLLDALEAVPCPECGRPTYTFDLGPHGRIACPACAAALSRRRAQEAAPVRGPLPCEPVVVGGAEPPAARTCTTGKDRQQITNDLPPVSEGRASEVLQARGQPCLPEIEGGLVAFERRPGVVGATIKVGQRQRQALDQGVIEHGSVRRH